MMRILVLSDTHIPRVAHDIPQKVYDEIEGVDMILHAGDFVEKDLLDRLNILKPTHAVCGNMDAANLRNVLNPKEVIEVEKVKIGLIHGYGVPKDLIDTVRSEFGGIDAIVFGHSHAPVNIVKDGVLFFNPGSPTDTIFATVNSYGILEVDDKKITGRIVRL